MRRVSKGWNGVTVLAGVDEVSIQGIGIGGKLRSEGRESDGAEEWRNWIPA